MADAPPHYATGVEAVQPHERARTESEILLAKASAPTHAQPHMQPPTQHQEHAHSHASDPHAHPPPPQAQAQKHPSHGNGNVNGNIHETHSQVDPTLASDNPTFVHTITSSQQHPHVTFDVPPPTDKHASTNTSTVTGHQSNHHQSKSSSHKSFAGAPLHKSTGNGNGNDEPNKAESSRSLREKSKKLKLEAAQALHPGTLLNSDDWEMIEDDLLPFELMVVAISLGAVALVGITIAMFVSTSNLYPIGYAYLQALSYGPLWTLLLLVPALVGIAELFGALLGGSAAALEHWEHISIQDLIRDALPEKIEHYAERVPLRCAARRFYMILAAVVAIVQLIVSIAALAVNDSVLQQANAGQSASLSDNNLASQILDFTAIVFNECCADVGFSKQGSVLPCPGLVPGPVNCTVPSTYAPLQHEICACHLFSPDKAASLSSYVNSTNMCSLLTTGFVPISNSDKIPGTDISIRAAIPPGTNEIPIVGDPNIVYGCGVGFYRGLQWEVAVWVTMSFRPYLVAIIVISVSQLVTLMVGYTVVCRVKHKVFDYDENGQVIKPDPDQPAYPRHRLGLRGLIDAIRKGDIEHARKLLSPSSFAFSPRILARKGSQSAYAGSPRVQVNKIASSPTAVGVDGVVKPLSPLQPLVLSSPNIIHLTSNEMMLEKVKPSEGMFSEPGTATPPMPPHPIDKLV